MTDRTEAVPAAICAPEPYDEEIRRLRTELERTEGDLAVAVAEAQRTRKLIAAVEADLALDEQAVWKVAYAQQRIIDARAAGALPPQEEQP